MLQTFEASATSWHDLADIWAFENDVFGADNVDWQTLCDLWCRYSRLALHVRDNGGRVVGTFDASPIQAQAFDDLREGRRGERDILGQYLSRRQRTHIVSHWCVTSLTARGSMAERAGILGALISAVAERLCSLPEVGWPSRWCAVAQSPEGRRLLERAGFRRYRADSPVHLFDMASERDLLAFRARFGDASAIMVRRNARRSLPLAA